VSEPTEAIPVYHGDEAFEAEDTVEKFSTVH
jgi:hypothetical protein